MLYKEIKETLLEKGWSLEYFQTSGKLDMLHFKHPSISGQIIIDFDYDVEFPENIENGEEFDYLESEFLNDYLIQSVYFTQDLSISYMSEGILDTCGEGNENTINLYGEDVDKHFYKVLSFLSNPYIALDFQAEYNKKVELFNTKIRKYFTVLEKYGIVSGQFAPYTGNESTIFKNFAFYFKVDDSRYDTVNFNFDLFNEDKHSLYVNIGGEEYEASIDSEVSDFDNRMVEIMTEFEKLKILRKEKISF